MASVYVRNLKNGPIWYAQVRLRNGHWKGFNTKIPAETGRNRGRAIRATQLIQAEIDAGHNPFLGIGKTELLREMTENFLKDRSPFLSMATICAYRDTLRRAESVWGQIPIADIGRDEIGMFRQSLSGMSEHSVNHYLRNMKVFLRWCASDGHVEHWTCPKIEFVRASESRHRDYYRGEECKRILDAAHDFEIWGISFRKFIAVLMFTGMRVGEVLAFRYDWVDFARREIRIPPEITKTNRRRIIPLPEEIVDMLRDGKGGKRIFPFSARSGYLREVWHRVLDNADVRHLKIHNLRDTYAVNLLLAGVPLAIVSQILGHASIGTTVKHYAEFGSRELSEALVKSQGYAKFILRDIDNSNNNSDKRSDS